MPLTVAEPAASTRLTTLDAAKAELNLLGSDQDAYLAGLIDQASAIVASRCSRVFAAETVGETFRVLRPYEALVLSRWPVIDIVSVQVDGQAQDLAWIAHEPGGLLYRLAADLRCACWAPGRVAVVYRAGYVLPGNDGRTLPHDVERAAVMLVRSMWHARGRDPAMRSDTVEGIGAITYFDGGASGFSPEVESLLAPYRSVPVT